MVNILVKMFPLEGENSNTKQLRYFGDSLFGDSLRVSHNLKSHESIDNLFYFGNLHRSIYAKNNNEDLDPFSTESIEKRLVKNYWGDYCALINSGMDNISILPDPTGSIEVFFYRESSNVYISNSMEWILNESNHNHKVRESAILDLTYGLNRYGPLTSVSGIQKITIGHVLRISRNGEFDLYRVWPMSIRNVNLNQNEAALELEKILIDVLSKQYKNSTGILLSGGKDSSLLASYLSKIKKETNKVGMLHYGFNHRSGNEIDYAKYVAKKLDGRLSIISEENVKEALSAFLSDPYQSSEIINQKRLSLASSETKCNYFIEGHVGDTIFLDEIYNGFLSNLPVTSAFKLNIHNIFWKTVYSKTFLRFSAMKNICNVPRDIHLGFVNSGLLTEKAIALCKDKLNFDQYVKDAKYFSNAIQLSKAHYILSVLHALSMQNLGHSRFILPFASQPVLDFLFSLNMVTLVGKEPRSLQCKMLENSNLTKVSNRKYKSTSGVMIRGLLVEHESSLLQFLERSKIVRNNLIDMNQLKKIFFEVKCGLPSEGARSLYSLIFYESQLQQLKNIQ